MYFTIHVCSIPIEHMGLIIKTRQVLTGRFALSKKKQFVGKRVPMLEFPDSIIRLIKVRVIQICLTTVYFLAYIYH